MSTSRCRRTCSVYLVQPERSTVRSRGIRLVAVDVACRARIARRAHREDALVVAECDLRSEARALVRHVRLDEAAQLPARRFALEHEHRAALHVTAGDGRMQ